MKMEKLKAFDGYYCWRECRRKANDELKRE
jgi:hypothetical protein